MDEKVYRIYKTKQFAYQFDDIGFLYCRGCRSARTGVGPYAQSRGSSIKVGIFFPNRGSRPRDALLRMQGYRYIIVGRHLIFYKCQEEERRVIIVAIIDKHRKYEELL